MAQTDTQILKAMGMAIARKRKVAGFTQEEVADFLGIGNEAFSRIERGLVSPGIPKLYAMAEMFECGIETFFVEGSRRVTDQAQYLTSVIEKLSPADRSYVVKIVEDLSYRLAIGPVQQDLAAAMAKR
ncbi:MAG: helix-turn-helix transcriptional regulator [Castellaniella sp.]|uniref:helix-turn-helix domain-containing protein n=1 Tax=Castellaniella sp. TaxID=1955812 RepID=UPI003C77D17C